jgi:hypothetical protein
MLAAALLLGFAAAMPVPSCPDAVAKEESPEDEFKGKWEVTLFTPVGDIPVMVSLQPNGKGKLWLDRKTILPVVSQMDGNWISWTVELPAVQAPDGNAHTIIGRGSIQEDGTMAGNLVIVTAKVDLESPVGFETHVGTFGAARKGRK